MKRWLKTRLSMPPVGCARDSITWVVWPKPRSSVGLANEEPLKRLLEVEQVIPAWEAMPWAVALLSMSCPQTQIWERPVLLLSRIPGVVGDRRQQQLCWLLESLWAN